jgi:pyruvate/2-oxoglutarate dehydrogenase complex dihydrolipoamide acyltransferase (E2) component
LPSEVALPELGDSVTEATVTAWCKSVGDRVTAGETLLEVSTDKVDAEVPSPIDGILVAISAKVDDVVPVGGLLALIGTDGDAVPSPQVRHGEKARPIGADASKPERQPGVAESGSTSPSPTTEVERTRVADADPRLPPLPTLILPEAMPGKSGSSTTQATDGALPSRPASTERETASRLTPSSMSSGADTEVKMTKLRKTIADRMVQSLKTTAQLTSVIDVDVTAIGAVRAAHGPTFMARNGFKLSYMPFFAASCIRALASNRQLNASLNQEGTAIIRYESVGLAIAVDTARGLMAPVIPGAETLTMEALARAIDDVAKRSRDGSIGAGELVGGTFTLSNTGSRGSLFDTPILNPPQVGILATGAIRRLPRVVELGSGEEVISIRSICHVSLTYDHQVVDGADAARYLSDLRDLLEDAAYINSLLRA